MNEKHIACPGGWSDHPQRFSGGNLFPNNDHCPDAQPEPHKASPFVPHTPNDPPLKREEGADRPPGLMPGGNLAPLNDRLFSVIRIESGFWEVLEIQLQANFVKVNPSGNTTVFILDPFPREVHSRIAHQVMRTTSLAAEQVGFVERATESGAIARLQMMGGEFCGNASCAFAAWLTLRQFPGICLQQESGKVAVPIEVSGHNGVLTAIVRPGTRGEQKHWVEISMPLPRWVKRRLTKPGGQKYTLVGFEGITHAVTWDLPPSEEQFHRIRDEVLQELTEVDCFGVMFYKEASSELIPAVYVPKVDSLVWEGSCGSGSVAVAAALADRDGASVGSLRLSQPGGIIEVTVRRKTEFLEAGICQEVGIEAEGIVFIHL